MYTIDFLQSLSLHSHRKKPHKRVLPQQNDDYSLNCCQVTTLKFGVEANKWRNVETLTEMVIIGHRRNGYISSQKNSHKAIYNYRRYTPLPRKTVCVCVCITRYINTKTMRITSNKIKCSYNPFILHSATSKQILSNIFFFKQMKSCHTSCFPSSDAAKTKGNLHNIGTQT